MSAIVGKRARALSAVFLFLTAWAAAATHGATFAVPPGDEQATWQAEEAALGGWSRVDHPSAAGGAYASSEGEGKGTALEFTFRADRPTALRVAPVWWRDGERTYARRFPYPLVSQPGPDALAECDGLVFFTAPANGRVGVFDPAKEALVGSIEVGGYLNDIVADPVAKRLYVADAQGDRIVVLDADKRRVVREVPTPDEPWALALAGSRLYVACRGGKCVAAIDPRAGKILGTADLPAPPVHLRVETEKPGTANVSQAPAASATLTVWFAPQAFDMLTCEELTPDERQYAPALNRRTSVTVNATTNYQSPSWGVVRLTVNNQPTDIDVSAVIGQTRAGAMVVHGQQLFFIAPASGRLGVIDLEKKALANTIEVGGKPTDLVVDGGRGKVYVADGEGDRVVVISTKDLAVVKALPMPAEPISLDLVLSVTVQRPELVPPMPVNRLYVACREGKALVAVDVATDQVGREVSLPTAPAQVKAVPFPGIGWWPVMALDRIPIALHPKVAIDPWPVRFSVTTSSKEGPGLSDARPVAATDPRLQGLHNTLLLADGRTISGDNQLVIGVTPKAATAGPPPTHWIDVTEVTDPQLAPVRPLTEADQAGAITLSVDGGPERDWTGDRWMTADSQTFLVAGTPEFERWNAPLFTVGKGEHTLRVTAHSPYANLDALTVSASLDDRLQVRLLPEPREVHGPVPLAGYQGVFYNQEPVQFAVELGNAGRQPIEVKLSHELRNYMGEVVAGASGEKASPLTVRAGKTAAARLEFAPQETGRFTLTVTAVSPEGAWVAVARFVRLPKLEHPRLFFRKEELPAIRERMARYPNLYRRYAQWLARQVQKEGEYFPQRFLPPGLTKQACGKAAPSELKGDPMREMRYGWRMYDLGWRMFACEFIASFGDFPEGKVLAERMAPLLAAETTDYYCQFHHHGPFFPGAAEALYDLAPDEARPKMKLGEFLAKRGNGDMNVLPSTLVTIEEPLTPQERALVYKIMQFAVNQDRFFQTHAGSRAGTWWQNPWTSCHCPMHAQSLALLFMRTFLGEDRLLEKPYAQGILTFNRYVDPIADKRRLIPNLDTPNGEPWRWLHGALTRHPLEHSNYQWDTWIGKLDGSLPGDEAAEVDRLFALEGMPNAGPLGGGVRHFVTGVSVPIGLALGWYDPTTDKVKEEELPPTTLFDFEGWAAMKSGWDGNATEVSFVSGARDHTNRLQPNHFTVVKAGDFLIGTPALYGDDGNPTPSWGNTVVVGEDWLNLWRINLTYPRDWERLVINRFSPAALTYINRDRRLTGFQPAESGWGGGLDLHGHTETPLWQQGRIIAYQTRPEFDYVAGDATNAWPADQVGAMYRQLVFLKPDLVVVYDRVKLRREALGTRWVAATAPKLTLSASGFRAGGGAVGLQGVVLLPEGAALAKPALPPNFLWKDQELLEVRPPAASDTVEYLVVLQSGNDRVAPPAVKLIRAEGAVGAEVALPGGPARVLFRQAGEVAAEVTLPNAAPVKLAEGIVDNYEAWRSDPRHQRWVTEPRFDFVVKDEG